MAYSMPRASALDMPYNLSTYNMYPNMQQPKIEVALYIYIALYTQTDSLA